MIFPSLHFAQLAMPTEYAFPFFLMIFSHRAESGALRSRKSVSVDEKRKFHDAIYCSAPERGCRREENPAEPETFFPTKWQQEVNNEKSSVKAFLFARFFTKIIFIVGEVTMRK
jgi:hypothetical protein